LSHSNGPLFTNQINSHFVNHIANQNDKVQIDYLVMLQVQIDLSKLIDRVISLTLIILDTVWLKNPIKETMNYNSVLHLNKQ